MNATTYAFFVFIQKMVKFFAERGELLGFNQGENHALLQIPKRNR